MGIRHSAKAHKLLPMSIHSPNGGAQAEHPYRRHRANALNARNKRNIAGSKKKQAGKQKYLFHFSFFLSMFKKFKLNTAFQNVVAL